jgi:histone H3/H4
MGLNRHERRAAASGLQRRTGLSKDYVQENLKDDGDAFSEAGRAASEIMPLTTPDERAKIQGAVVNEVSQIIERLIAHVGREKIDLVIENRLKVVLRSDVVETATKAQLKLYVDGVVDDVLTEMDQAIEDRVKAAVEERLEAAVQQAVQAAVAAAIVDIKRKLTSG